MAKPIIKTITPFDAATAYTIEFIWTGTMAYNNRMVIYDADSMLSVYDHTYSSNHYVLDHVIPAGTLVNGKKYAVQVAVINQKGKPSEFSDKVFFNVIAAPQFYFDGLIASEHVEYDENLIESQTYKAQLVYKQVNNEPIASYQFFLYSSVKRLLDASDIFQQSTDLSYTYRSLESNTNYYLRATGYTQKGIPLDTGYVLVTVSYMNPSMYARLYATPNTKIGTVDYYSNIVDIESDRPGDEYTYEDGFIDLTESDPNKKIVISKASNLTSRTIVNYLDINGSSKSVYTDSSSITISKYNEINKIVIWGKYQQVSTPTLSLNNYQSGSYIYMNYCNLTVDGVLFEDISEAMPLRSLPKGDIHDELTIEGDGRVVFEKNIGEVTVLSSMTPTKTGTTTNKYGRNMFTAYYDVGLTSATGTNNLVCDALPVSATTSCVKIVDGLLAVMWDTTEFNVTNMSTARTWLSGHKLSVLYPLKYSELLYLSPIALPRLTNVNSVRYSNNFIIPNNATVSVRMKDAFKTCEILRVQSKDKITFILSSTVYDDKTLRYKLDVKGPASDYIIYSEPFIFTSYDIMTVHVRRINGVYGLYAYITQQDADPPRNMWFMTAEPPKSDLERDDVWMNMDYPTSYIDKNAVVRFYQNNKPTGASLQNIWIGN